MRSKQKTSELTLPPEAAMSVLTTYLAFKKKIPISGGTRSLRDAEGTAWSSSIVSRGGKALIAVTKQANASLKVFTENELTSERSLYAHALRDLKHYATTKGLSGNADVLLKLAKDQPPQVLEVLEAKVAKVKQHRDRIEEMEGGVFPQEQFFIDLDAFEFSGKVAVMVQEEAACPS